MRPDPSLRRPPPDGLLEEVVRAGRWRRARLVVAGTAVLCALGAAVVLPRSEDSEVGQLAGPTPTSPAPDAHPGCPASFDGRHPPRPTRAFDAAVQLAPETEPVNAVVCRYSTDATGASRQLDGRRELTGDLTEVPADLSVPAVTRGVGCAFAATPQTPYLLRLGYADGTTAWVADVEGQCPTRSTNGAFISAYALADRLAGAYASGVWSLDGPPDECSDQPVGRAGQERALVPAGWNGVNVCERQFARGLSLDQGRRLVDLVDGLPLTVEGGQWSCPRGGRFVRVTFDYPQGRSVSVQVSYGCTPTTFDNGSVAAAGTADLQEQFLQVVDER